MHRRIGISEFKKMQLINIREYYEKDEKFLPGKKVPTTHIHTGFGSYWLNAKGISLTVDQYMALLRSIPEINANLRNRGVEVNVSAAADTEESEAETKPQKRVKAKPEKSNIETTSEEDDEWEEPLTHDTWSANGLDLRSFDFTNLCAKQWGLIQNGVAGVRVVWMRYHGLPFDMVTWPRVVTASGLQES